LQLEPDNPRYRQKLAKTEELLGDHSHQWGKDDEATRCYRQALELNPQDALVWYKLGIAYQELGQRDAAREAYTKAAELNPEDDRFKHARDQLNAKRAPAPPEK
jgi:Flp pilus assembly protein TadD